jgi:putative transposase
MTKSSGQTSLVANEPLDIVQIDHIPADLIFVDSQERRPIGRPYLTVAIDVCTRCICGFYLSLDLPSVTSVALCITSIIANKTSWSPLQNFIIMPTTKALVKVLFKNSTP